MRRRLKYVSLLFDGILLESGVLRVWAGPHGSSSMVGPPSAEDADRFQTAHERRAAVGAGFQLAMAEEGTGAPAKVVVASTAAIAWRATLHPFALELPTGCDWINYVTSRNPSGDARQVSQRWTQKDKRNAALRRALPEQFVRDTVISAANRDLVLAATAGVAASFDPLHLQVVEQRFRDDQGWKLRGFAVPILFPAVGKLPWEDIRDLRAHKQMADFRKVLREVEDETSSAAASGGDYEEVTNRVYRKHLADDKLDSVGGLVKRTSVGLVIGGSTGFVTSGITGPLGLAAGTLLGSAAGAVLDVRNFLRDRRARGWVAVDQRLTELTRS